MRKELTSIKLTGSIHKTITNREGHRKKLVITVEDRDSDETIEFILCECNSQIKNLRDMLDWFNSWVENDEVPEEVKEARKGKDKGEEDKSREYIG